MRAPALALVVLLAFLALSGSGASPSSAPSSVATHKVFLPGIATDAQRETPPVDDIVVTSTGDPSRAVTKLITAEAGGTVSATGADGTQYTLTIEPGGLLFDQIVTMTPVKTMIGLPAGLALGGGVLLAPDGLELAIPARLTIDSGPTSDLRIGVFHESDSGQLTPAVVELAAGPTTLLLPHFSTWGEATGPSQSVEQVMAQEFEPGPESWMAMAATASNEVGLAIQQGQPLTEATNSLHEALRMEWPFTFQPELNRARQSADAGNRPFPDAYRAMNAVEVVRFMSPPVRPDDIVDILIAAETEALQTVNVFMTTALDRCNANRTPQNIEDVKRLARRMKIAWGSSVLAPYDFSQCQGVRWVGTLTYYEEHRDSLGSLVTMSAVAEVGFDHDIGSLDPVGGSELTYEYSYRSVNIDGLVCTYASSGTKPIGPIVQNGQGAVGRLTVLRPEPGSLTGLWRYHIDTSTMSAFSTETRTCSSGYSGPITFWPLDWFAFDRCGSSLLTYRHFDPALGQISGAFEDTTSTSPLRLCRSTWDLHLE